MYKSAFKNSLSALMILDRDLIIRDINEVAISITGLSSEIINTPFQDYFYPEESTVTTDQFLRTFQTANDIITRLKHNYKEVAAVSNDYSKPLEEPVDKFLLLKINPIKEGYLVEIKPYIQPKQGNISFIEEFLNGDNTSLITALELYNTPFCVINMDSKQYVFQNNAHKEMIKNLVNMENIMNIPDLVDKELFLSVLREASSNVFVPFIEEHEYLDLQGQKRYYKIHGTPVLKPADSSHFLILQYWEQTQEVWLKKEVADYKRLIRELFTNLPGMVFRCLNENSWTMEYISPSCKEMTGYTYLELVNNNKIRYGDLIHPDDRPHVWQSIQDAIKRKRSYTVKYRLITRKGKEKWVQETGKANFDNSGVVVDIEGFISDISEGQVTQQKLKRELQVSEAIARIGFDILKDTVSPIDIATQIQEYIIDFTGSRFSLIYAPNETDNDFSLFVRTNPEKVSTVQLSDYTDQQKAFLEKMMVLEEPFIQNQKNVIFLPGYSDEAVEVNRCFCIPAFTNNKLSGLLIAGDSDEDFTNEDAAAGKRLISMFALGMYRLKAEEKLQEAKCKAEESDRLKSLFLSNMSHEIRTPMNAIVGFAEMLQDSDLSIDQKNKFLEVIIKSGDNLLRLINDIIDISKIEAGQLKFDYNDCLVNEMIADLETFFKRELVRLKKTHLNLYIRMGHPESDFALQTDSTRLKQVLNNLIGNAIKFTDEGFIEFGYEIKAGTIEFFVRDSGIGIARDKQDLIFERFGQVQEAISRNLAGTGLGLTISKNLVELMGGRIWVDSMPGEGSTFFFTLPLRMAKKVVPINAKPEVSPSKSSFDLSGRKILIVEDVDTNYFYLSSLLQKFNCKVIRAANGQRAVDMVKEDDRIDLVLMDIELPILDGYQATRLIKETRPDLPVIAQTAFAMMGEREKSREAGCNDYLSKPIRKEELLSVLKKFL